MFERFSDRSRKVMALSNQQAQRFNHEHIGPVHIALGLFKEGSGCGCMIVKNLVGGTEQIQAALVRTVDTEAEQILMGKLPQNAAAKRVVAAAVDAARALDHNYVGTEHILLGLFADDGIREVFGAWGLTREKCEGEWRRMMEPKQTKAELIRIGLLGWFMRGGDHVDALCQEIVKSLEGNK